MDGTTARQTDETPVGRTDGITGEPGDSGAIARLTRWILLTGNRLLVSLLVVLGILALFVAAGLLDLVTVTRPSRTMWYLNGAVNGLLTLVPIVVGVNQIVLSHEFGSIGDLYQRRASMAEFRERIERRTGYVVSSPAPSMFFGTLLTSLSDVARALGNVARAGRYERDDSVDDETIDAVREVAGEIRDGAERTANDLADGEPDVFRTFVVLQAYDDSRYLDDIRRLRAEVPEDEDVSEGLRRIEEYFLEIDAARQYLKTTVVERQLAQLSRLLVYTGVPAVAVATLGIFAYRDVPWLALPTPLVVLLVGTLVATTFVPLAILSAYVLRVATIARRTAMYGPFVPDRDG